METWLILILLYGAIEISSSIIAMRKGIPWQRKYMLPFGAILALYDNRSRKD